MKKILPYILSVSLFVYLIIVLTFVSANFKKINCKGVEVNIYDAEEYVFVDEDEVLRLLKRHYGELHTVTIAQVDQDSVERALKKNAFIKSAQFFYDLDGNFHVGITQRKPVMRVISNRSFYIDEEGKTMPLSKKYTPRVVVATGNISETFACERLYPFVMNLREDSFWEALVEQIVVTNDEEVILIPKVGNFRIRLGELEQVERKLENLYLFLQEGIALKGWNNYREINLKYENQIVCVKK